MELITANSERLASTLTKDIRRKGLRPGDRYMTAAEAGKVLGVGVRTADRALQVLAKQDILIRERSRGTFVGPAVEKQMDLIQLIHFVMPLYKHPDFNEMVNGLHGAFPGASIQFSFLPEERAVDFMRNLVDHAKGQLGVTGLIVCNVPRDVCRFVQNQILPVVSLNSDCPVDTSLDSVNTDYAQTGELLIDYVLERGHCRVGLLAWDYTRPGDHLMMDRINERLAEAKLPSDALVVRNVPEDQRDIEAETRLLLSREDRPTAIICRSWAHALGAGKAVADAGLSVPDDVLIVCEDRSPQEGRNLPYPYVTRVDGWYDTMFQMLQRQVKKITDGSKHVVTPVVLREPEGQKG